MLVILPRVLCQPLLELIEGLHVFWGCIDLFKLAIAAAVTTAGILAGFLCCAIYYWRHLHIFRRSHAVNNQPDNQINSRADHPSATVIAENGSALHSMQAQK